jgi:hypothetical protein
VSTAPLFCVTRQSTTGGDTIVNRYNLDDRRSARRRDLLSILVAVGRLVIVVNVMEHYGWLDQARAWFLK